MKKIPLLTPEDIEVRVKQVSKSGALALIYKTARVDRRILNDTFGLFNWTSDYRVINDNLYCGIGVREDPTKEFVWKWDCGIESREDEEGNEKKGEASDAFKRAAYQWSIGEELYSAPFIFLDVATVEKNGKWYLQDPYAKYVVTHIAYNEETRVITELQISNAKTSVVVFNWVMPTTGATAAKMNKTLKKNGAKEVATDTTAPAQKPVQEEKKETPAPEILTGDTDEDAAPASNQTELVEKLPLKVLVNHIGQMVKAMHASTGSIDAYNKIVADVTGGNTFKCNLATDADYDKVLEIYNRLNTLNLQ